MMGKKNGVVCAIFCLICCLLLASCNSKKDEPICDPREKEYDEAVSLFNKGEYFSAGVLFENLGDYNDADAFVEKCHEKIYEKAEQQMQDGSFEDAKLLFESVKTYKDSDIRVVQCEWFCTMEASILDRMKSSSEETKDLLTLVNTEISFLSKFEKSGLRDERLDNLFKKYMDGLKVQKDALGETYYGDYQREWIDGKVMRMEVLRVLYDEYSFLSEDRDFVARYIAGYESDKLVRDGYFAVMDDIWEQRGDGFELLYFEDTFGWKMKNNTEFTFSIVWEVNLKDDDTIRDSDIYTVENVEPGQSYIVEFWWPDYNFNFDWQFYFTDMSK